MNQIASDLDEYAAAMEVARLVYGAVPSGESPQWQTCLKVARALNATSMFSSGALRPSTPKEAMSMATSFNQSCPVGTYGNVVMPNGEMMPVRVDQAAMIFPSVLEGETVLAWSTNIAWFDVRNFTPTVPKIELAKELVLIGQQANAKQHFGLAETLFKAAMKHDDQYLYAYNELGALYGSQHRYEEADDMYTAALAVNPNVPECLTNRAMVRRALGRPNEAIADARRSTELMPQNETMMLNYASTLDDVGDTAAAVTILDKHLTKSPNDYSTHYNKSLVMLAAGYFEKAWPNFVWRLKQPMVNTHYEHYQIPRWNGETDLKGKRILVWTEQGLGDEIMTMSMMNDLIATGADIACLVSPRLVPVIERSFPTIAVGMRPVTNLIDVFRREPLRQELLPDVVKYRSFDYQMSQGDLGHLFRPDWGSFPFQLHFLKAPQRDWVDALKAKYPDKKLIGLSWHSQKNVRIGALKSMTLKDLIPVLKTQRGIFVNLQYGDCAEEIAAIENETGVTIISPPQLKPLSDMDGFFSLVDAMDLVITASNTTAHVAGALGKYTWLLTPCGPGKLWYWHRDRSGSPWYPSLKLYRQSAAMDWKPVINEIANDLANYDQA